MKIVKLKKHLFIIVIGIFLVGAVSYASFNLKPDEKRVFTFIVPQESGGGTSIWATILSQELDKYLDGKIVIKHMPGDRDMVGFNKFEESLRFDDTYVMVSHGGNAISYLTEDVQYDYRNYEPIAIMNYNIVLAKSNYYKEGEMFYFPQSSGFEPDALAIALLACGPDAPVLLDEKVSFVKGMSSAERRLSFMRGELSGIRENPVAYSSHIVPMVDDGKVHNWFNHGIYDKNTNSFVKDPNLNMLTFEELYAQSYNNDYEELAMYKAYILSKAWRDGLQKALWVNKDNPYREDLMKAFNDMLANEESRNILIERFGNYPWQVGEDAELYLDSLYELIEEDALATLIDFNMNNLGLSSTNNYKKIKEGE